MLSWSAQLLSLDLKYTWKISRNSSDQKVNLIIEVKDGLYSGKGEAAPNVRYKESPEDAMKQFERFLQSEPGQVNSAGELIQRMEALDLSYALRFALESAWHHLQAQMKKITVPGIFGLPPALASPTAYTIPIMDPAEMKPFYIENKLSRFRYIKLKVDSAEAFESVKYLSSFSEQRIMIDANEAYRDVDSCIYFLEKIRKFPIEFVEQPLPSAMKDEQCYLKKYSPLPLFADESVTHEADFSLIKQQFDGINVKLMKAGGYLNAIRLLKEARKYGLKTMIGCMVESTLGISSGMHLQSLADYLDLDSFLFLKNEPYKLVKEEHGELIVST